MIRNLFRAARPFEFETSAPLHGSEAPAAPTFEEDQFFTSMLKSFQSAQKAHYLYATEERWGKPILELLQLAFEGLEGDSCLTEIISV